MFDHDNSGEDLNIGMMDKTGLHFKMREFEIFDEQAVREFIDGVVEGRARPYLRSEKIPKKAEPAGKLKKIVARNFEMIMNDATSDKFIFMFKEGLVPAVGGVGVVSTTSGRGGRVLVPRVGGVGVLVVVIVVVQTVVVVVVVVSEWFVSLALIFVIVLF